jgi:hypothetical protein
MNEYANGKIYKVTSPDYPGEIYVGSTIMTLNQRWRVHKSSKTCQASRYFQETGIDRWKIELICDYPCSSRQALNFEEQKWIDRLGANLNQYRAYQTYEQLQQQNRESKHRRRDQIRQDRKEHYQQNREAYLQKKAEPISCPCGVTVSRSHIASHRRSAHHKAWEAVELFTELPFSQDQKKL